ncbi:hypothetical protein [Streptomyces spororaveus]|nr:hypothetical protein [Streptomyces spororaveus]
MGADACPHSALRIDIRDELALSSEDILESVPNAPPIDVTITLV